MMRVTVSDRHLTPAYVNADLIEGLLDGTLSGYRGMNTSNTIKELIASTYAAYGR